MHLYRRRHERDREGEILPLIVNSVQLLLVPRAGQLHASELDEESLDFATYPGDRPGSSERLQGARAPLLPLKAFLRLLGGWIERS
ncbi:MAG: hypothetical protein OXN84_05530 [Albidovulum sp.]|nr:hypothetical protein [Albidovulum sp.]